jgi:branched-chain amino acid transport system substrate-binding protein
MSRFKLKLTRRQTLQRLGAAGAGSLVTTSGITRAFAQDKSPIKIGVILPLSGAYAAQGTGGAQGIQLLAEQVNAKGGLLGRQVQVLVEDSQLRPQTAVVKATKLIQQDGCKFLMGEISGASTLALLEVAEREKVVMMTPYSSPEAVTGARGTRYQFRTYSNAYIQAAVAVDCMIKTGGKKWGVMAADYAYGQDYVNHLRKMLPAHGATLVSEAFPALGTTDFVSHLQQASSGNPDVLWMVEYGRDATVALNQAVSMGLKSKMKIGLSVANTEQVAGMQSGVFDDTYSFITWYPNWASDTK